MVTDPDCSDRLGQGFRWPGWNLATDSCQPGVTSLFCGFGQVFSIDPGSFINGDYSLQELFFLGCICSAFIDILLQLFNKAIESILQQTPEVRRSVGDGGGLVS